MGAPAELNAIELRSLHPVRAIRMLLRMEQSIVAFGVLAAFVLMVRAVLVGQVGDAPWELSPTTATYAGLAITTFLGALWLGFMARGLAVAIHLLANAPARPRSDA